jgi:predicted class III extradiol MEMO1 family dioxygenase
MDSQVSKPNVRKFKNTNILKVDTETLNQELFKESIITDNLKINGGNDYVTQNYDLKLMILPSSGYNISRDQLIPAYKLFKYTKNFSKIKRVFLLGYSHFSLKSSIYLSAYYSYEGSDNKKLFEIDQTVYSELLKNDYLKKYTEYFEINSYTTTTFIEEAGSIKEREEEYSESAEDNEYTFDVHLSFLTHLIENKIKIVPIWVNLNQSNKDVITELGDFLNSYFSKEENFFVYSSNLSYFGRIYNYFGDGKPENKEFKSKSFLRDPSKEEKTRFFLKSLDDVAIKTLRSNDFDGIFKLSNFNYCKELFATLCHFMKGYYISIDLLSYQIKRYENIEEGFELNLVSMASLVYYFKTS